MQKDETLLDFSNILSEKYLAYALSTITSRSLPDVRDGLKPVHRRLLFAMRQLKLNPSDGYKKSARVVGDVMGKFHPHGDIAIYESMVRLAQEFAMRYPLVDGQGNFGNLDGDNAAAMRYTEARMTEVSKFLMDGIDEDAVDFRKTYDGEDEEPIILPAGFPNLLANGAQGIAVGMATSIPPHNIIEICDASIFLIKNPNIKTDELLGFIKGPDFPTGGTIVESKDSIINSYITGKGGFRLRSKWFQEKITKNKWQIIITEIPYQVQKSKLLERIVELIDLKKISLISNVRDESAEDVRIIIEPKSYKLNPSLIMESLFKMSDLETRISLNLNVLDSNGKPNLLNLKQVIKEWLEHRKIVLIRRKNFQLKKINKRLEVLEGFLIIYFNLNKVIEIIRDSDDPKIQLMKSFKLTVVQAESILDMRLRSLRRIEEEKLNLELKKLKIDKNNTLNLLKNEKLQWNEIILEINQIRDFFKITDNRKTNFEILPDLKFNSEDFLIEKEEVTIICSKKGWIRSVKGHQDLDTEFKFKDGDEKEFVFHGESTNKIILFLSNGYFYTLNVEKIPKGRGVGEPLSLLLDIDIDSKVLYIGIYETCDFVIASDIGHGFIVNSENCLAHTRGGKRVLNLNSNSKAVACKKLEGNKLALLAENRRLLIIDINEIPKLSKGKGVILQRYKDSILSDIKVFFEEDGLTWKLKNGKNKKEKNIQNWISKRGGLGKRPPIGFTKLSKF